MKILKDTHTQGEWKEDWNKNGVFISSEDGTICKVSSINGAINFAEFKRNAKLIAAAPELLEALQKMHDTFNADGTNQATRNNANRQAINAIQNATL
tara:strand:+ start:477 stop:767 length:291 start_codon:yes stop_codon:yes gene_type:complete